MKLSTNLENLFKEVAEELGISSKMVKKAYLAYWYYVKTTMRSFPLEKIETEEEFQNLRPYFSVPFLGRFYAKLSWIKNLREAKRKTKLRKANLKCNNNKDEYTECKED